MLWPLKAYIIEPDVYVVIYDLIDIPPHDGFYKYAG